MQFVALRIGDDDPRLVNVRCDDPLGRAPEDIARALERYHAGEGRDVEIYTGGQVGRAFARYLPAALWKRLEAAPDDVVARFLLDLLVGLGQGTADLHLEQTEGAPMILAGIEEG